MSLTHNYWMFIAIFATVLLYTATASSFRDYMKRSNKNIMFKRQNMQGLDQQQMCFTIPHLQALKEQFANYIDTNKDERASPEEIMDYLRKYSPDISEEQVLAFIARRDKDGDGSVDFIPDYLMEVSSPDFDINTAKEWFSLEDTNGDGYVSQDELIAIAEKVGMSRKEAKETVFGYYMSADVNGDHQLSWEEYLPLFLPA